MGLASKGPAKRLFPGANTSILVVVPQNVARAEELFRGRGLKVMMGSRYIAGFIGEGEAEKS